MNKLSRILTFSCIFMNLNLIKLIRLKQVGFYYYLNRVDKSIKNNYFSNIDYSNSVCKTLFISIICYSSSSVRFNNSSFSISRTLLAVSQPIRFNSSIIQPSISSPNSSMSTSSTSTSLSR